MSLSFNLKAGGLQDEDLFLQLAIQEGGLDIHMMEGPSFTCSMGKQQPDRFQASYRGKHLVEVDPLPLDVPLG